METMGARVARSGAPVCDRTDHVGELHDCTLGSDWMMPASPRPAQERYHVPVYHPKQPAKHNQTAPQQEKNSIDSSKILGFLYIIILQISGKKREHRSRTSNPAAVWIYIHPPQDLVWFTSQNEQAQKKWYIIQFDWENSHRLHSSVFGDRITTSTRWIQKHMLSTPQQKIIRKAQDKARQL